jgi:hypothetical protein
MVLWVWSFIGGGEIDYLLFIVSGFLAAYSDARPARRQIDE